MERHENGVVALGDCDAHSGVGDPYLPFREILQLLSGGTGIGLTGSALTPEHGRRLWSMVPNVLLALVEHGPDLIGRLLPTSGLALRAESWIPSHSLWWSRWHEILKHRPLMSTLDENAMAGSPQSQDALFEQVGRVLRVISQTFPLILLLDDLQWVDTGSASLLFHLGRHLARSRILIVGAYRPEMVTPDSAGRRHVLQPVVNELRRDTGDSLIDLDQAANRAFVDALLDTEPHDLGERFRDRLYRVTGGHALFTGQLLRAMKEHGDLALDESGRWTENEPSIGRGGRRVWTLSSLSASRVSGRISGLC